MNSDIQFVESEDIRPLRHKILRKGKEFSTTAYERDKDCKTFHLAAFFENKIVRNTSINIRGFDLEDIYSNFLYEDFSRKNRKYTYNPDINGGFLFNVNNSFIAEFEADYVNIHF